MDLDVLQCDRDAPMVKNQLAMMAQFLRAVSKVPDLISCSRVCVDVIRFGQVPSSKVGVHYPYIVK